MGIRSLTIAGLLLGAAAHASPPSIHVYESHRAGATTEGDATIATDPDRAYRTAIDYARWHAIFPDVSRAIVEEQQGDDARVTFVHVDGSRDRMHFRNRPTEHAVWFEQLGGHADVHGEIVFAPGPVPGTTHVHSQLYADVHGVAALFVSGASVRAQRQEQVRDDLRQLQRYFAPR